MAKKNLYINNTSLGTFGIYISSDTVLNSPSFDYVEHQVPGRDGTLLQYNNRLNNVIRKFSCHIPESGNIPTAMAKLKKLLYKNAGYMKIQSDYESGVYQYGYLAQDLNVVPFDMYTSATFDLYFSCMPMKYGATSTKSTYVVTPTSNYAQTYPRNCEFIRQFLNSIDPNDVPDSGAFCLVRPISGAASDVFTNISATFSATDTFVACCVVGNYVQADWKNSTFKELAGYSTNSSLSISTFTATYGGGLYFIVPADAVGTLSISLEKNGTSHTYSYDFNFIGDLKNTNDVIGASVEYELELKAHGGTSDQLNIVPVVYLVGYSDGVETWHGTVQIETDNFRELGSFARSTVICKIDSQTLETSLTVNSTTVKGGDLVILDGDLDGTCDEIKVFIYTLDNGFNTNTGVMGVSMTPTWWTL